VAVSAPGLMEAVRAAPQSPDEILASMAPASLLEAA
jgi:hypothetical protein